MARPIRLIITLVVPLSFAALPVCVLAQDFGVSPAEVRVDDLAPGSQTQFDFTIRNKDDVSHIFTLSTYNPEESEMREGRTEIPDDRWISFCPQEIEVAANSRGTVRATVAVPSNQKWAGKNWEIWIRVAPESTDLLVANCYIRLLVSTSKGVEANSKTPFTVGIVIVILLLGYGLYYFRRSAKARQAKQ
jgi:hypothetical protein